MQAFEIEIADVDDGAATSRGRDRRRFVFQLQGLRRLVQPYFLDLQVGSGFIFVWLLLCLCVLVVGVVLFLMAGIFSILQRTAPATAKAWIDDEASIVRVMFDVLHSAGAPALPVLCSVSLFYFYIFRKGLRERRWVPWLLLGGIVFVILVQKVLITATGHLAKEMTHALVEKEEQKAHRLMWMYGSFLVLALPIRTVQNVLVFKLRIFWREWLSKRLIRSYMAHRAYYDVDSNGEKGSDVDNPDQRIAGDTKSFTQDSLEFTTDVFDFVLSFVLHISVLWRISPVLTRVVFAYTGAVSVLVMVAFKRLTRLSYDQLRYEADFRYGLVHIRDNAEAIAFYCGEGPETAECERRLDAVVANLNRMVKWHTVVFVVQRVVDNVANFLPYCFMLHSYLQNKTDLGDFNAAKLHFKSVAWSLSFVVYNVEDMAGFWAGVNRLEGFQGAVDKINKRVKEHAVRVAAYRVWPSRTHRGDLSRPLAAGLDNPSFQDYGIILRSVRICTPGGQVLVDDLSFTLGAGQRVLVAGPSGCGKTSLLRVASGLWHPETGDVERPNVARMLFLPQKPYMLLGSLRDQLCYPLPKDSFDDESLVAVLRQVELPHIVSRFPDLDVKLDWPCLLSLGEQQRVAFARVLLNRAEYAVLDEATSALDEKTERILYNLLVDRGTALLSVGHRPSLRAFHDHVLELTGDGGWRLTPTATSSFGGTVPPAPQSSFPLPPPRFPDQQAPDRGGS